MERLSLEHRHRLRDAVALLVFEEHHETDHAFEHDHDGDGWNEPYSDSYGCRCGGWSMTWVQTDRACSGRPEPADALLAWADHVTGDHVPDIVLVWDTEYPARAPSVFRDGSGIDPDNVPAHLFAAVRTGRYTNAPSGVLYTRAGAVSLNGVLEEMWNCEDVQALRGIPAGGEQYREENLVAMAAAQKALDTLWSERLKDLR